MAVETVEKFPDILVDEKLEIEYVGMLLNNPKGISMFHFFGSVIGDTAADS